MGSPESMNVPIWFIIGFQQRDRQNSQNLNNDSFCRLPVTSVQCITWAKSYPDAGILINYNDDDLGHGYAQIKEVFRALTKDDILQPHISKDVFRSSNAGVVELGCTFFLLDIRYQQNFTASEPVKVEFKFDGVVPNDVNGYALTLTKKLVSISSDGQRHFDFN